MKKLVIIGASYLQNPLILKAKECGYETHVFAWECGDIGERTADVFYPISIVEKERILEECRKIRPEGVCTIGTDLGNVVAQYVAREMGLPCNSQESVLWSSNKYEMRKRFRECKIPVPLFFKISQGEDVRLAKEIRFPVIVKPTDRSGSRGINKIYDWDALEAAVLAAQNQSFEKCAIVEEYIEGEEYSCEGISYKGKHSFLAVTKKYTTGSPHFIEYAHVEPSGLPQSIQQKVFQTLEKALTALQIENGASHSEFKVDEKGEIHLIEIGARMGGDCIGSHLVPLSTGHDYLKMVIDTAVGLKPSISETPCSRAGGIRFIFGQEDVRLLNRLLQEGKVLEYQVDESFGESGEVTDSSARHGYFIVSGSGEEEIKRVLELK